MSIKILAGRLKGMVINVPDSARPTLSRFRESLFDILESSCGKPGHFFEEKTVLDCFAGSGALGIEALSRGAAFVYFIDASRKSIQTIYENIERLHLRNFCKILKADALKMRKFEGMKACDVVFTDPPYGKVSISETLQRLHDKGWIDASSVLITEEDSAHAENLGSVLQPIFERKLGNSIFKIGCMLKQNQEIY